MEGMDQRRAGLTVLWVILVGGCSFEASCGGKKIDSKKGETEIAKMFAETGLPTKVTCPTGVKIKKDATFDCAVDLGGVAGKVQVTQTDEQGNVSFELVEGFVLSDKLEKVLGEQIKKESGVDAKLDCGERVRASTPGATFRCTARAPSGEELAIDVTIKDKLGRFSTQVAGGGGGGGGDDEGGDDEGGGDDPATE
jgi:hypothetical protein